MKNDEFECPFCGYYFQLRRLESYGKVIRCPECAEVVADYRDVPPPKNEDEMRMQ